MRGAGRQAGVAPGVSSRSGATRVTLSRAAGRAEWPEEGAGDGHRLQEGLLPAALGVPPRWGEIVWHPPAAGARALGGEAVQSPGRGAGWRRSGARSSARPRAPGCGLPGAGAERGKKRRRLQSPASDWLFVKIKKHLEMGSSVSVATFRVLSGRV